MALVSGRGLPLIWEGEAGLLRSALVEDSGVAVADVIQGVGFDSAKATVTAEDYGKWYELYLVPGLVDGLDDRRAAETFLALAGVAGPVSFPEGDGIESDYCDHCPNPIVVQRWALACGYQLDAGFLHEAVVRWRSTMGLDPEEEARDG